MTTYLVKDSQGETHIIDADSISVDPVSIGFGKKGEPGFVAQFRDWANYRVQLTEPVKPLGEAPADPPKNKGGRPRKVVE